MPGVLFLLVPDRNLFIITILPKTLKMTRRIGGMRRKTRYKFRKEVRAKGKISLSDYFQSFDTGDKVHLGLESGVQKGMYRPNFMGKTGVVKGKRGRCYEVQISDFGKQKTLIVHPVHLKRA